MYNGHIQLKEARMAFEWAVADAMYGGQEMVELLQADWEPFGIAHVMDQDNPMGPPVLHIFFKHRIHTEADYPRSSTREENMQGIPSEITVEEFDKMVQRAQAKQVEVEVDE